MKNKITYTILIIATLLIGVVIGFLANGRFTHHRIEKMRKSFNESGCERGFERIVKPTPEQMEQLRPILTEFAENQKGLMYDFRTEQRNLHKELRSEISPILTEEQIERFDRSKKKMEARFKDEKRPPKKHKRPSHTN